MTKLPLYCTPVLLLFILSSHVAEAVDGVIVTGYKGDRYTCTDLQMQMSGVCDYSRQAAAKAAYDAYVAAQPFSPVVVVPVDAEKKKKEEDCKNKEAEILEADAKATQCRANARTKFSEESQKCSPVTEAILHVGGQFGFNGDVSGLLRALNIKAGAVVNVNASGTLKWNPNADCRMKLEDIRVSTAEQCDATASNRKAELAACPKS